MYTYENICCFLLDSKRCCEQKRTSNELYQLNAWSHITTVSNPKMCDKLINIHCWLESDEIFFTRI